MVVSRENIHLLSILKNNFIRRDKKDFQVSISDPSRDFKVKSFVGSLSSPPLNPPLCALAWKGLDPLRVEEGQSLFLDCDSLQSATFSGTRLFYEV